MKLKSRTSRIGSVLDAISRSASTLASAPVANINLGSDRMRIPVYDADLSTPSGQIRLSLGDVVNLSGGPHIVDLANESRARCIPLCIRDVSYQTTGGKEVKFQVFDRCTSISPCIEQRLVVERRGEAGLKEFFASKVARREIGGTTGNTTTRTNNMSKQTINGIKLPTNPYDAKAWQEIHSGGSKDEIAGRIAAAFKGDKKVHRADPANALKYMDEKSSNNYQSEMTEAGLAVNIGKAHKAVGLDAPAGAPSVPKAAPVVTLAPEGPAKASGSPTAKPAVKVGTVVKPLTGNPVKKSAAAKALAFVGKGKPGPYDSKPAPKVKK